MKWCLGLLGVCALALAVLSLTIASANVLILGFTVLCTSVALSVAATLMFFPWGVGRSAENQRTEALDAVSVAPGAATVRTFYEYQYRRGAPSLPAAGSPAPVSSVRASAVEDEGEIYIRKARQAAVEVGIP